MAVASVKSAASAAEVREYARSIGRTVGKRGRFSPELIAEFNAQHDVQYVEGGHVHAVEVVAKSKNGRKIVRTVSPSAVRAAAKSAGIEVGTRGRISQEIFQRYVLGTL